MNSSDATTSSGLTRRLSLIGLASTGICSMLGASIYIVPVMIQRNVPGIGPFVLPAFIFAAIPALLAAFAYATLSSAMPRAGGSYLYASRGLSPYLGFVASFSQWFGLSIAIGVVSYVIPPFIRDILVAIGYEGAAASIGSGNGRLILSLSLLWFFVWINYRGIQAYERTIIPLMILMFALGALVMVAGFWFTPADFLTAIEARGQSQPELTSAVFSWDVFLSAAAVLFSSFIGFDSIAQAGGEAKNPGRNLPLAIGIAVLSVGSFYFIFTAALYHAVPWQYVAREAQHTDLTAPGLMGFLLSPAWTVAMMAGAAIALTNDLPAMLLSVSRLMYAWAADRIFPMSITAIHSRHGTPYRALFVSGITASIGIIGCHLAGDFFLGVDILVTSMLVNFLLMCVTLIRIGKYNPTLASEITVLKSEKSRVLLGVSGAVLLFGFLIIHITKDLRSELSAWYFHSTFIWIVVMIIGSTIFFIKMKQLRHSQTGSENPFMKLPEDE